MPTSSGLFGAGILELQLSERLSIVHLNYKCWRLRSCELVPKTRNKFPPLVSSLLQVVLTCRRQPRGLGQGRDRSLGSQV